METTNTATEPMTLREYLPTAASIAVENYPYGFRLKTTLTDYIEFNPKKGFRHCTQTVDPRNGRINAPKKSTYYPLMLRFYNEVGHIKTKVCHFNGDKEINSGCKFIAEHFEIFTAAEINYFYSLVQVASMADFKGTCIYGGSKPEELQPFYLEFWKTCKEGIETGKNLFASLVLNTEGIEATKPENFSPFKATEMISLSAAARA
jgi:hypothetical protein